MDRASLSKIHREDRFIMKADRKGFSVIELMAVSTVVGIFSAVALPAYQEYTVRSKVSESIRAAASVRDAVSQKYQNDGMTSNNTVVGVSLKAASRTAPVAVRSVGTTARSNAVKHRTIASKRSVTPTRAGATRHELARRPPLQRRSAAARKR